jgi:hypothetical protein
MRQLHVLILLLFLAGLAACGHPADPTGQKNEVGLATRVGWVLPENWSLEKQNGQFIITRHGPVRSHICVSLDLGWMRRPELLRKFVEEYGNEGDYKIRLRIGPRVDLIEHARLTESNSKIPVTRDTVISNREFFEAAAMESSDPNYVQLPDYYDRDSSIYVESTLHPWECIYPDDVARECQRVLDGLDLIFSRYPGAQRLTASSWMGM